MNDAFTAAATTVSPAGVAPRIGFVSLGCPKALTDSELILTQLSAEGYQTSKTFEGAAFQFHFRRCDGFVVGEAVETLEPTSLAGSSRNPCRLRCLYGSSWKVPRGQTWGPRRLFLATNVPPRDGASKCLFFQKIGWCDRVGGRRVSNVWNPTKAGAAMPIGCRLCVQMPVSARCVRLCGPGTAVASIGS